VLGSNADSGTVAMAAYLMADLGQPDTGLNARLFEARHGIPRYGQAFLLMALARAKADKEQIDTLKNEIIEALESDGDSVIVHEDIDMHEVMGSDVRSSAIHTSALLMVAPDHPIIDKLVEGLKKEQLAERGLAQHAGQHGRAGRAGRLRAHPRQGQRAGGGEARRQEDRGAHGAGRKAAGPPPHARQAVEGHAHVEGSSRALFAVRLATAKVDRGASAEDHGFEITREYLDPDSHKEIDAPKANQLILVRPADQDRERAPLRRHP
jgi:hypothetical protein